MMRHLPFSEKAPMKTGPSTKLIKTARVVAGCVLSHGRTCFLLVGSVSVDNVTGD